MTRDELTKQLKDGFLTPVYFRDLTRDLQSQYQPTPDGDTTIGYYLQEKDWFIDD